MKSLWTDKENRQKLQITDLEELCHKHGHCSQEPKEQIRRGQTRPAAIAHVTVTEAEVLCLVAHLDVTTPVGCVDADGVGLHQLVAGEAAAGGGRLHLLLAILARFGLDDIVRLPALAVALLRIVLREVEVLVAFGLFTAPAENDVASKAKELAAHYSHHCNECQADEEQPRHCVAGLWMFFLRSFSSNLPKFLSFIF